MEYLKGQTPEERLGQTGHTIMLLYIVGVNTVAFNSKSDMYLHGSQLIVNKLHMD